VRRIRLALLYGGDSSERDVSIASWRVVQEQFDPGSFDLAHFDLKYDLARLIEAVPRLDAAFICMHGRGGEDGALQGFLEQLGLPYQGSGVLASALAMNKKLSKVLFRSAGLNVPPGEVIHRQERSRVSESADRIGFPLMVKPSCEGSSIGMSLVREAEALEPAVERAFQYDSEILLEQYIRGVEVTCGILGNAAPRALPLVEIVPSAGHEFFDLDAKYAPGATEEICPARLNASLTEVCKQAALTAHRLLGCQGYSRVDMIVSADRAYVLEVNTIPGMTRTSLYPQAARAAGIEFPILLEILVDLALGKEYPADGSLP